MFNMNKLLLGKSENIKEIKFKSVLRGINILKPEKSKPQKTALYSKVQR